MKMVSAGCRTSKVWSVNNPNFEFATFKDLSQSRVDKTPISQKYCHSKRSWNTFEQSSRVMKCTSIIFNKSFLKVFWERLLWIGEASLPSPKTGNIITLSNDSGGGSTPLDKLYRYVPPHRVGFLCRFGLKTGIHFAHFGLELGVVFEGTTEVY